MSQFPQPARPSGIHDASTGSRMNEKELPYHFPDECHYVIQQYSSRAPGGDTVEVDDDLLQILREFADQFDDKGGGILNKLLSKLENNVSLDYGKIREKLEEFRGRNIPELSEKILNKLNPHVVNNPLVMQRGVNCDSTSADEEQELKLERFKVRTVNHGGVVKVEKN